MAQFGKVHFAGYFAWLLWLFIHLMKIVNFRNRVLVFMQWAWSYFSYDRSARLITGKPRDERPLPSLAQVGGDPQRRA